MARGQPFPPRAGETPSFAGKHKKMRGLLDFPQASSGRRLWGEVTLFGLFPSQGCVICITPERDWVTAAGLPPGAPLYRLLTDGILAKGLRPRTARGCSGLDGHGEDARR